MKTSDNLYIDLYNKIMKKLNVHQKNELELKYKPTTFKSIRNVPSEYLIFSLRNIFLRQWTLSSGFNSDISHIEWLYNRSMKIVKNPKYKHKVFKSTKIVPVNKRFYCNYDYYDSKGQSKNKTNELQFEIDDGFNEMNELYEEESI